MRDHKRAPGQLARRQDASIDYANDVGMREFSEPSELAA
jgi:hypothetical protein